uniref:Uncharacterized protein n=1 Tax=Romanomermis culicivorax TaxID=13658 RepID=A0A915JSC5_ROMCU
MSAIVEEQPGGEDLLAQSQRVDCNHQAIHPHKTNQTWQTEVGPIHLIQSFSTGKCKIILKTSNENSDIRGWFHQRRLCCSLSGSLNLCAVALPKPSQSIEA